MPVLVAQEAQKAGRRVVAAAVQGITDPALEGQVETISWVQWGDLEAFISVLECWRDNGVTEAIMAGKVEQQRIYEDDSKGQIQTLLSELPSGHTDQLLSAVAKVLEASGIRLLESTRYLRSMMPPPGWTAGRALTSIEEADINHGWAIAKALGRYDIGQTVAIKRKAVVAVEGMEGTDACIGRAGDLAGPASVVIKVAKPGQDLRFDVPVIGAHTLEIMHIAGASAIAFEADMTVLFDLSLLEDLARQFNIAMIARVDDA